MKRIKIISATEWDEEYRQYIEIDKSTTWEPVSDEEYSQIVKWANKKNKASRNKDFSSTPIIIILCEYPQDKETCIKEYFDLMKKDEEKAKNRKLAIKKAKETKKIKELEKKRKEFEALKKEFGE